MNNNKNSNSQAKVYEQKSPHFSHTIEISATYLNLNGKILFLKLAPQKSEALSWGVPAGKLEAGETSIQAARREFQEETRIEISADEFKSFGPHLSAIFYSPIR